MNLAARRGFVESDSSSIEGHMKNNNHSDTKCTIYASLV